MGILDGNQKHEPMHYGEVFSVWRYVAKATKREGLVNSSTTTQTK